MCASSCSGLLFSRLASTPGESDAEDGQSHSEQRQHAKLFSKYRPRNQSGDWRDQIEQACNLGDRPAPNHDIQQSDCAT